MQLEFRSHMEVVDKTSMPPAARLVNRHRSAHTLTITGVHMSTILGTVSTPEAPRIPDLPIEIIEEFIQCSPSSSWPSLALASRLFHSLTTPYLYRNINLSTRTSIISCARTLVTRPATACSVHSLSIHYTSPGPHIQDFYDLILQAFCKISGLQQLKVSTFDDQLIHVLERSTFPHLTHFECEIIASPALIHFANHHPTLKSLELSPFEHISPNPRILPTIQLPRLESFSGNAQTTSVLGPSLSLRAAFVIWDAMDSNPEPGQPKSSELSKAGWNLDLVEVISNELPSITALNLFNVLVVDSRPSQGYVDAIRRCLPRFKCLQRLSLNCVDRWQMGNVECAMDSDFETVTKWGEVCPSIQEIILPHSGSMTWRPLAENIWIPDPNDPKGAVWLGDAITGSKYPVRGRIVNQLLHESAVLQYPLGECDGVIKPSPAFGGLLQSARLSTASAHRALRSVGSIVHCSSIDVYSRL
ncbi:hypothetical protein FA15DRAFT_656386 [Coprinopsis marcescibilis]|uniref:F-box domain-containing protein n=1 Tax=Coprinopsis marcescibilis TaxID=230819 RepID=A0A5C3KUL3_COPMA|nr:hypothetical protein FA15DRAFT_656386 [Coprinopsis marcescibilis]